VRETGFLRYGLGDMAAILLAGWSAGILSRGWQVGGVVLGGAALLGLVAPAPPWGGRRRGVGVALGLAGWMVLPLAGIWFVSNWQPLFTDRYLIWAAPAFYLLAGAGLASLRRRVRWLAVALTGVALSVFVGNLWVQVATPIKSDFRAAAAFVEERYEPGDLLLFQIPHARYTFDYYFAPPGYAWADGLYTNHRTPDGGFQMGREWAGMAMSRLVEGRDRVWLIASEMDMWDQRHLVHRWLEENGTPMAEAHFVRVDVYLYRMDRSP